MVYIPSSEIAPLKQGSEVVIHTYLVVRENALDLYGSQNPRVIEWFKSLLNVKGVGPKSALAVCSAASPEDLSAAVHSSSAEILVNCGVSKKQAETIVLELKNKAKHIIDIGDSSCAETATQDSEALSALESLGYSREQARDALKQSKGEDVETKIREALKNLGK